MSNCAWHTSYSLHLSIYQSSQLCMHRYVCNFKGLFLLYLLIYTQSTLFILNNCPMTSLFQITFHFLFPWLEYKLIRAGVFFFFTLNFFFDIWKCYLFFLLLFYCSCPNFPLLLFPAPTPLPQSIPTLLSTSMDHLYVFFNQVFLLLSNRIRLSPPSLLVPVSLFLVSSGPRTVSELYTQEHNKYLSKEQMDIL